MGGGDLNLKKSWHPSTMKNMEKVWKAEQQDSEERKRIAELKNEIARERDEEELKTYAMDQGVIEKKEDKKLDWMYKSPTESINREEYLLGRAVDKQFEQVAEAEKDAQLNRAPKNHVEHECIPPSLRFFSGDQQVDLQRKLQEDPLYLIKKKEMESRAQLLKNPVKLKQLKEMLEKEKKDNNAKVKKKKKHSDKNKQLDDLLAAKYKQLRGKINTDKLLKSVKKTKKNSKKKKSKSSSDSSSDSSSSDSSESSEESDSDNSNSGSSSDEPVKKKIKKHKRSNSKKKLKKKKNYSESDDSSSESSDENEKSKKSKKKKLKKKEHSVERTKKKSNYSLEHEKKNDNETDYMNWDIKTDSHYRKQNDDSKHKYNSHKCDNSNKESYGLMKADGTKLSTTSRYSPDKDSKYKVKQVEKKEKWVPQKRERLTEEEKERRRREMISNASERDKERTENYKKHKKELERESEKKDSYNEMFLQKHLAIAADVSSVESRIKSKINNLQRSKHAMDGHFARR